MRRPLVADTDPHPRGRGPAAAGGEHGHGGVVCEEGPAPERVAPNGGRERLQQRRRASDPVRQGRAVEVEPVAPEDLALAIEREVVAVLGHQHVGEEPRPRPAALDGPRGQRRLHEAPNSPAQAKRGRVMRFTTKRPGTPSGSSVSSSPIPRSRPPHRAQASSRGTISTSMRGTWSGIGRRFGWRASSPSSGRRRRPMMAPAATSLVPSARWSCSALSPEAPWRRARWPAN